MGFGRSANYALWSPSALTVHRTVIHYLLCSNPKDSHIQGIPLRYQLSHGGDDGIRTHDPLLAGQVLSQLSYTPILSSKFGIPNSKLLGFAFSPFCEQSSHWQAQVDSNHRLKSYLFASLREKPLSLFNRVRFLLSSTGRPKWTRTTDLVLIRHAL